MIFLLLFFFVLGTTIGSFLNVLIDRPIKQESILGRSHCDYCKKKLSWFELFPILSFIFLKGKSRCCNKRLSFQYPLVELITGLSYLLIFNFQFSVLSEFSVFSFQFLKLISLFGIVSFFIVVFFSDFKYRLISDYTLLLLFIFSFLFNLTDSLSVEKLISFFFSGIIVGLPIFLIYYISRERAMGLGDVYLSAIVGFLLGWKEGFLALYIAFLLGAIFGLTLILLKIKKLKSKIAFGPFIVVGAIIMLFWGEKVIEIIKRVYGF